MDTLFATANTALSAAFGYHISPDPAASEWMRQYLADSRRGGLARFLHAVRVTQIALSMGQVENHPQDIHAALEALLWRLRPFVRLP